MKKKLIFLGTDSRYEPSYYFMKSKQEFLKQFHTVYSHTAVNLKNSLNKPSFVIGNLEVIHLKINLKNLILIFMKIFYQRRSF